MKKILCFLGCLFVISNVNAADRNGTSRSSIAPRATVGVAHTGNKSSLKWEGEPVITAPDVVSTTPDRREAERTACMSNNGWGVGNTFVWASRYSNSGDYSSMVEDIDNPENNVCWVRVELHSGDNRIDLSDISGKYFEMGTGITCGDWVNSDLIEKRILDAKKSARAWATVGGVVGGAGVGVGAMELFGNKLIGGAVQGQKALSGDELFISQLKELKNSDPENYATVVTMLKELKSVCAGSTQPDCKKVDYDKILTNLGE